MNGGNAVDSMVATALCQGVMNPVASGIGGGAFIVVRLPNGTSAVIDAREIAPAAASETMFAGNTHSLPCSIGCDRLTKYTLCMRKTNSNFQKAKTLVPTLWSHFWPASNDRRAQASSLVGGHSCHDTGCNVVYGTLLGKTHFRNHTRGLKCCKATSIGKCLTRQQRQRRENYLLQSTFVY